MFPRQQKKQVFLSVNLLWSNVYMHIVILGYPFGQLIISGGDLTVDNKMADIWPNSKSIMVQITPCGWKDTF